MRIIAGVLMLVIAVANFSTGCRDVIYGGAKEFTGSEGMDAGGVIEEEGNTPVGAQLGEESKELAKEGENQAGYGIGKIVLGSLEVFATIMLLAGAGAFFIRLVAGLEILSVVVAITVMESDSYVLFGLSALAVLSALIAAQGFRAPVKGQRISGEAPLISEVVAMPPVPATESE